MIRFKQHQSNQFQPFPTKSKEYPSNYNWRLNFSWETNDFSPLFFPENHRTQSQHERHRVTKLVLFEFVNNFLSLFYIAFIIGDMDMLRSQVQTMLIISQAITNFQETVQPLALKYYALKVSEIFEPTNKNVRVVRVLSEQLLTEAM